MALQVSRLAKIFAVRAVRRMPQRLVLQRPPISGETQTDSRGFPSVNYTDIDPDHPIPTIYMSNSGREVIIGGQARTVTLFSFEIPGLNYIGGGKWVPVDFSPKYRVHLLASDDGFLPEQFLQIIGGGNDIGPSIRFPAVILEELV